MLSLRFLNRSLLRLGNLDESSWSDQMINAFDEKCDDVLQILIELFWAQCLSKRASRMVSTSENAES